MSEPRTIELPVEPATRESFAPYGVSPPFEGDGQPTADLVFTRNDGWVNFIGHTLAEIDTPARALSTNINGTNRNTNSTRVDGATNQFTWLPHHTLYVAPAETMHVEAWAGAGRPVAVVPGLFGASFAFRKVIPLLAAQGFRPIVIEPLGTGFSSRPPKADYSLAAQSHRLAAVLDSLHSGPVLVLAHSLGAAIAFRLAVDRPDLVSGIVSLEGGPTEEATTPMFRSGMRYLPWVKLLGGISLVRRKIRGMLLDSSGDRSWVTDGVVMSYTLGEARDLDATPSRVRSRSSSEPPTTTATCRPRRSP